MNARLLIAAKLGFTLALGAFGTQTQAQQVYRIVGADGRVTFSDQAPPSTSNAKVTTGTGARSGTDSSTAALPFELREPATKYPVTLYTGNGCGPCSSGKALLAARGVPFNEKTVNTSEDAQALQRLSGDSNLPFLTIGGQQIKGFSDVEWGQYLDAAGYPKSSVLPAGYRSPPPTALVAVQKTETTDANVSANGAQPGAATQSTNRRAAARPATAPAESANPAGIQF